MKRWRKWRAFGLCIMAATAGLLIAFPSPSAARMNKPEQAAQSTPAQKTPESAAPLVTDSLELRDAPFREALHFLFVANAIRYDSIELNVGNYDTTFSYTGLSLLESLQAFNEKGPSAFTYVVESGVYLVKPVKGNAGKPASIETTALRYGENTTHRKDRKERDVLRRVSGLLKHEVRSTTNAAPTVTYFALLETTYFIGDDKDTLIRVVTTGTQPRGVVNTDTMVRVVKVDAKGVMLKPDREKAFFVPLAPLSAVQK